MVYPTVSEAISSISRTYMIEEENFLQVGSSRQSLALYLRQGIEKVTTGIQLTLPLPFLFTVGNQRNLLPYKSWKGMSFFLRWTALETSSKTHNGQCDSNPSQVKRSFAHSASLRNTRIPVLSFLCTACIRILCFLSP